MLEAVLESDAFHNLTFHHDVELAILRLAQRELDCEPLADEEDEEERAEEAHAVHCELLWLSFHL